MAEELASMQQQVDTLQRIVNLKDDQIAALQSALEEAGGSVDEGQSAPIEGDGAEAVVDSVDTEASTEDTASQAVVAPAPVAEPEPEPAPKPAPKPAPAPAEEGGLMSYLLYGLGAVLLLVLGSMFLRRRKEEEDTSVGDEAFADVELKSEPVAVVAEPEPEPEALEEVEPEEDVEPVRDNRGYGERKHDEYASDVETGDALAEADIYIAYGRYPQAKDLLQNAINAEPGNAAYRLKLLETELQMGNRAGAEEQLRELEALGDAGSVARAQDLLGGGDSFSEPPAGLAEEVDSTLESDFAGLEIEDNLDQGDSLEDDLDLSADFGEESLPEASEDEDLVIAAEANGMSTKLDLARAYMDMGDEDGARQILEEVIAEGSEENKAEAGALLERIG